KVMHRSKDMQSVVTCLDEAAKKNSGRENPLLRRVLGQVLLEDRNQPGLAVTQLRQVLELKPDDAQALELLIRAYERLGQPAEATETAFRLAEVSRRDIEKWKDLGRRFAERGQVVEAERAYTSLIEMLPNEAEGHHALAQVRESENRWDEALTHWK